jgi:preprotein translocase subunit SecG
VGNLLYLVVPAMVAAAIIVVIVLRNRKPSSMEAGIDAFSRELRALAPERGAEAERDRGHPG